VALLRRDAVRLERRATVEPVRPVGEGFFPSFLEVDGLSKSFGSVRVLEGVSFTLARSVTLGVLGRSGCGKTTLLKVLAGIEAPSGGRVLRRGEDITHLPIRSRDFVYLYQETLLFPHLSVFENVAFGLRLRKRPAAEIEERVFRMLSSLELQGLENRGPEELSGGQRQRVSFGRALIVNPSLLLLDEPFSNLDTETRANMQSLFKRVAHEQGITAIFVTHDLKEALIMGDHLAQIQDGHFRSYASVEAFIDDPASGVSAEREFWETLGDGRDDQPV
jgi:ABC-type Fe3+/spermidine/putrescine transport system ATPase subunit